MAFVFGALPFAALLRQNDPLPSRARGEEEGPGSEWALVVAAPFLLQLLAKSHNPAEFGLRIALYFPAFLSLLLLMRRFNAWVLQTCHLSNAATRPDSI
jgi:hypothetical protein